MIRGLYTSGLGMTRETKRMDVIANNLANASTNAFKADGTVCGTFAEMLQNVQVGKSTIDIANYTPDVTMTYTKYTQGSLNNTSNNTDLAIVNDDYAFFEVENDEGELLYTRDGAFKINKDGYLVTNDNYKVLGSNGEYITLSDKSDLKISVNGDIVGSENQQLGKISIRSFENPGTLTKIGNNYVQASDESVYREFTGEVEQGYIEMSNVNTVEEMVNMISVSRAYEANQKVLQAHDDLLSKAASQVGKVG